MLLFTSVFAACRAFMLLSDWCITATNSHGSSTAQVRKSVLLLPTVDGDWLTVLL